MKNQEIKNYQSSKFLIFHQYIFHSLPRALHGSGYTINAQE